VFLIEEDLFRYSTTQDRGHQVTQREATRRIAPVC
jgi:hypothetical protein